MSARTSLQLRVELFLAEGTRLGHYADKDVWDLHSFSRHVQAAGHRRPLKVEVMTEWARGLQRDNQTWLMIPGNSQALADTANLLIQNPVLPQKLPSWLVAQNHAACMLG